MLIKITNYCSMGCSHCMEDSTVSGAHMSVATFKRALTFTKHMEAYVSAMGLPQLLLLSGGECTESPHIFECIDLALANKFIPVLITNGSWLDNDALRHKLLAYPELRFQITNDARFYPNHSKPKSLVDDKRHVLNDMRITYISELSTLLPIGRLGRKKNLAEQSGLPIRQAPTSFNLRSLTISYGDVRAAIAQLRLRAMMGQSGHCTPSISFDGVVHAGESGKCFEIGSIWTSTAAEITQALINMSCNRCGLEDNLTSTQKTHLKLV